MIVQVWTAASLLPICLTTTTRNIKPKMASVHPSRAHLVPNDSPRRDSYSSERRDYRREEPRRRSPRRDSSRDRDNDRDRPRDSDRRPYSSRDEERRRSRSPDDRGRNRRASPSYDAYAAPPPPPPRAATYGPRQGDGGWKTNYGGSGDYMEEYDCQILCNAHSTEFLFPLGVASSGLLVISVSGLHLQKLLSESCECQFHYVPNND